MSIALKLLPALLLIAAIVFMATASRRAVKAMRQGSRTLGDWSLVERVQLFERTLGVGRFELRLLDMDQVNALALPNGDIYLSSGLYNQYLAGRLSRDEVSAIIAHEMGHVALGHHARRLDAWRIETAALAAIVVFLAGRAFFGWIGLLSVLGLRLARARLSRQDEFESDAFAAQMMMRAGLDPQATVSALKKADQWSAAKGLSGPVRWLLSHPTLEERLAHLEAVIAAGVDPEGDDAGGSGDGSWRGGGFADQNV
jgi:putative metalloprotease